jgi:hypothetical protein
MGMLLNMVGSQMNCLLFSSARVVFFCLLLTTFTDWVIEQGSIINTTSNGEAAIALLLTENGGGTLLSSTRYVHYGQITARREYLFVHGTFLRNLFFTWNPCHTSL